MITKTGATLLQRTTFKVAILAGGESRRMGQDKANLEIDGISMLQSVVSAATGAGLPVIIIGRARDQLSAELLQRFPDVQAVPDDVPGRGPVAGLVTALRRCSPGDAVLLLPCDVPGLQSAHIHWIVERAALLLREKLHIQTVVPVRMRDGLLQSEPLFAIYSTAALAPVEQMLRQERASLRGLLHQLEVETIDLAPEQIPAITDVDTPAELQRLINRKSA